MAMLSIRAGEGQAVGATDNFCTSLWGSNRVPHRLRLCRLREARRVAGGMPAVADHINLMVRYLRCVHGARIVGRYMIAVSLINNRDHPGSAFSTPTQKPSTTPHPSFPRRVQHGRVLLRHRCGAPLADSPNTANIID